MGVGRNGRPLTSTNFLRSVSARLYAAPVGHSDTQIIMTYPTNLSDEKEKLQEMLHVIHFMSPLPTMIKGLLADFNTEMASVMPSRSAKLTGGGGQQDTTLQQKRTSLNAYNLVSQKQFCVEKKKKKEIPPQK